MVRPKNVGDVEGSTVMVRRNVELSGRPVMPMNPILESKVDLRMIDSQATTISTVALESGVVVRQTLDAKGAGSITVEHIRNAASQYIPRNRRNI